MHESTTGMTEAPFSNKKNDTEITVKEQYGGDSDDKEIVQLQIEGRGLSLVDGTYDKPLACFGCGIGWFSFLLGFAFPPIWYYATVLYFGNYLKGPRERPGLAASAIAALICSVIVLVTLLAVFW
ncbi:hypothetical protein L3X38_035744 [Prunus dulcis]|uniref:Ribosomal protein L18ae family n=1 Tax=Prunus dulcis TaxID=3755 RepID=A0AAD4VKB0_PRUDU|nr:hypothetical protein L3X38_035744 [Prunus dulcis]